MVVARAKPCDFLDHLRLLVDLDRENPAIGGLIPQGLDGRGKAVVQPADLQIDQILDTQYHGQIHAPVLDTCNHVGQRYIGLARDIRRGDLQLPGTIDAEVALTPVGNVV